MISLTNLLGGVSSSARGIGSSTRKYVVRSLIVGSTLLTQAGCNLFPTYFIYVPLTANTLTETDDHSNTMGDYIESPGNDEPDPEEPVP